MDHTQLLIDAAASGNVEEVERLRPLASDDGSALCWAAYYGHSACVALLRPAVLLPQTTLRAHSSCDWLVVVELLMFETSPLCLAASQGHTACVRLLLDDPHINEALLEAADGGHEECVDVLYPLADLTAVMQMVGDARWGDRAAACLEKRMLLQTVCPSTSVAPPRKI